IDGAEARVVECLDVDALDLRADPRPQAAYLHRRDPHSRATVTTRPAFYSASNALLREQRLRARQLRSLAVRLLAERGELGGVRPGLGAVARELGSPGGTGEATEAIRLDAHRRLELAERLHGLVGLEEHLGQELTGRRQRARRDRMLLRRVLALGRRAEQGQGFLVLLLRPRHPAYLDRTLDVAQLRPVTALGRRQRVSQRAETIGIAPRAFSVPTPGRAERAGEDELRLRLREPRPGELFAEQLQLGGIRPATTL